MKFKVYYDVLFSCLHSFTTPHAMGMEPDAFIILTRPCPSMGGFWRVAWWFGAAGFPRGCVVGQCRPEKYLMFFYRFWMGGGWWVEVVGGRMEFQTKQGDGLGPNSADPPLGLPQ